MIKKIILFTFLGFLSITVVVIFLYWRTNVISNIIQEVLNREFKGVAKIEYRSLRGDLLQRIFIDGLVISLENGSTLRCASVQANYSLFTTISDRIDLRSLSIDSLRIHLQNTQQTDTSAESSPFSPRNYIDNIPDIHIGNLEVRNSSLINENPPMHLDSMSVGLSVSSHNKQVDLDLEEFSCKWIEKNIRLKHLGFELTGGGEKLTMNKFNVRLPESYCTAYAEIDFADSLWGIVRIQESYFSLKELNSLVHVAGFDSGNVSFSADLMGTMDDFSGEIQLQAEIQPYVIEDLSIQGVFQKGYIEIKQGALKQESGSCLFSGYYSKNGGEFKAEINKLDLNRTASFLPPTTLNGNIELKMNNNKVDGQLFFVNSYLDSSLVDTVKLSAYYHQDTLVFQEPAYLKFGHESKLELNGWIFKQKYLDLNIYTEKMTVHAFKRFIQLPDADGMMDANLFITGPVQDPDMQGFIWFPSMKYREIQVDSLILQLQLDHVLTRRKGNAHFSMRRCAYQNIKLMEVTMNATFDSNRVAIDTLVCSNNGNYIALTGFAEFRDSESILVFEQFHVFYEGYWLESKHPVLFQFTQEDYSLEQAVFIAPNNTELEIRGFYEPKISNLQLGVDLTHIPLEPFNQFITDKKIYVKGRLTGDLNMLINKENVNIDGRLFGNNIAINTVPFGTIECLFSVNRGQLLLKKFEMKNEDSLLKFNGNLGIQFTKNDTISLDNNIDLSLSDFNMETYAPLFNIKPKLSGMLSGSASISGPLDAPNGNISLKVKDIAVDKYTSDELSVELSLKPDTIYIDTLQGDVNNTSFTVSGFYAMPLNLLSPDTLFMDRYFELVLTSEDDRLDFIGLLSDQVEYLKGNFKSKFNIQGSARNPVLKSGSFSLSNGTLVLSRIQDPITNIDIKAHIEDGIMKIDNFSGYSEGYRDWAEKMAVYIKRLYRLITGRFKPEGTFQCRGTIDLNNFSRPAFNLDINADNLYLNYFIENTKFYFDTDNLHIGGQDTLSITGDIVINQGENVVDLAKLQKNVYLTDNSLKRGSPVSWNIHVIIPGNFIIQSSELDLQNNFKFEISGEVHSIMEPFASTMELTGSLDILPGKYTMYGQALNISTGTITFNTPRVINPDIYLFAEKMSRDYRIELTVTGKMDKLDQSIRVLDPNGNYLDNLSEREKLSILSFGTPDISGGSLAGAGVDVLSTSVQTAVERGAESLTGLDKVQIGSENEVIDHRTFQLNEGLGDVSFSLGKYLTHNLYIEYSSRFGSGSVPVPKLSWEAGNNIGLQYKIGRNWSIDSKVSQDETGNIYRVSLGWKKSF